MKKEKKAVIIFLIITFMLSSICYYIYIAGGKAASGITALLMWCPGITAIIIKKFFYNNQKPLGLNRCDIKYIILGIIIPLLYLLVSYGIYWAFNPVSFKMKLYSGSFGIMILAVFSSVITAMGEEIGWRGFLLPEMDRLMSRKMAILICGLIWAVWHFPLMISGLYNSGTPAWYQLPMFTIDVMLMTSIMAYLRFNSKSIWPTIMLHASHNYIDQLLCAPSTNYKGSTFFVGETGFITVVCILIAAVVIYKTNLFHSKSAA